MHLRDTLRAHWAWAEYSYICWVWRTWCQ